MKKIICTIMALLLLAGCGVKANNTANTDNDKAELPVNDAIQKILDLDDLDFQLIILNGNEWDLDADPFEVWECVGERLDYKIKGWKTLSPLIYGVYFSKLYEHRNSNEAFVNNSKVYVISRTAYSDKYDVKAWFENTPENLTKYGYPILGKLTGYISMYLKKLPADAVIEKVESENGEMVYNFTLTPEQFEAMFREYVDSAREKRISMFGFYTDVETIKFGTECHGTIKVNSEGYVTMYSVLFKNEENHIDQDEPKRTTGYSFCLRFNDPGHEFDLEEPNISEYRTMDEYLEEREKNYDPSNIKVYKPIIYLYPEKETEVTVKLGHPENVVCSYPKYVDGWNVTAYPGGDLVYNATGRKLYSLYWEGNNKHAVMTNEGFCVKGEDTAEFLEEKLALLGLNEREAEEFIIYWLPIMENNKYNYIRFESIEEINAYMPLDVTPAPDTIIRVNMVFKALEEPVEVKPQEFVTPERIGFTVVEWGGTPLE